MNFLVHLDLFVVYKYNIQHLWFVDNSPIISFNEYLEDIKTTWYKYSNKMLVLTGKKKKLNWLNVRS